jgi:hypothetical protein
MAYRAVLNYDFSATTDNNQATKLKVALTQAGWEKGETTAYFIERDDLHDVWKGVELFAKQCADIGTLSAMNFHIQLDALQAVPANQMANHPNAQADIEQKPWP